MIEVRFQALLSERNWLVHNSRSNSRRAVYNDSACAELIQKLDGIADEALELLKIVGAQAEVFVKDYGVASARIDELTAETLKKWHGESSL